MFSLGRRGNLGKNSKNRGRNRRERGWIREEDIFNPETVSESVTTCQPPHPQGQVIHRRKPAKHTHNLQLRAEARNRPAHAHTSSTLHQLLTVYFFFERPDSLLDRPETGLVVDLTSQKRKKISLLSCFSSFACSCYTRSEAI
jgi:hypothetical protein